MDHMIQYAMSFLGTPYHWGGNNSIEGIDCSGFACELLRSVGLVGNKEDLTAQQIYALLEREGTEGVFCPGAFSFYGESVTKITHVAFMIDAYRILEAGGGDSKTLTLQDAARRNALVRMRLVKYRGDLVSTVKPRYAKIGLI